MIFKTATHTTKHYIFSVHDYKTYILHHVSRNYLGNRDHNNKNKCVVDQYAELLYNAGALTFIPLMSCPEYGATRNTHMIETTTLLK